MTTDDKKISDLYQQGKDQMPPEHIDDAILKAAHEVLVDTEKSGSTVDRPAKVTGPFSGGWPAVTAIAAVLIITVILVPLINQQAPPATSHFATDKQPQLPEQDSVSRNNVKRGISEVKLQARKHINVEVPKSLGQQAELSGSSQEAMRAHDFSVGKVEERMNENSFSTMGAPLPATMKSTMPEESEKKPGHESIQQSASELLADKDFPETLTPAEWLKEIRLLIEQGNLRLAKQELDEFKTVYPDKEIDPLIIIQIEGR